MDPTLYEIYRTGKHTKTVGETDVLVNGTGNNSAAIWRGNGFSLHTPALCTWVNI